MAKRIFLASSTDGYDDLLKVAGWLEQRQFETLKWRDAFPAGGFILSQLLQVAKEVDGAICIFTPDDVVVTRGATQEQPRDNVLIEYGIFAAALGHKSSIICQKGSNLKIASDVAGIIRVDLSNISKAEEAVCDWAAKLIPRDGSTRKNIMRVAMHCSDTREIKGSEALSASLKHFYKVMLQELYRLRVNINTCGSEPFRDVVYDFYCDTFLKTGCDQEHVDRNADWIRWYWHDNSRVISKAPLVFRSIKTLNEDERTWAEADDAELIVAVCGKSGTEKQIKKVLERVGSKLNREKPVIVLGWFGGEISKFLEQARPRSQEKRIIRRVGTTDFTSPRPDWHEHVPELATELAKAIWQVLADRR